VCSIEKGFDFLGFNFREYPDKNRVKGTKKGIFLIKPCSIKIKIFVRELIAIIKKHKNSRSSYNLVSKLNQNLRGWAEHYCKVTSQKAFSTIHYHVWKALWSMIGKKHKGHSKSWLYKKYFEKVGQNKWIFVGRKGKESLHLFQIPYVPIKRHMLCKDLNAYDPETIEYFFKKYAKKKNE